MLKIFLLLTSILIPLSSNAINVPMKDFELNVLNEEYEEITFTISDDYKMKFINKVDWRVGVGGQDIEFTSVPIENYDKSASFVFKPLGKKIPDYVKHRFLQLVLDQTSKVTISDLQPEALQDGENTLYFYAKKNLCNDTDKYSQSLIGFTDIPPKSSNLDYTDDDLTTFAYLACVNDPDDFDSFFNLIFSLKFI